MKKQIDIRYILQVSSGIIANPSKSLRYFGIGMGYSLLLASPLPYLGKKIFDFVQYKQRTKEEKERIYKEVIAKQQAAIQKQQEINKELEILLRESKHMNDENKEKIAKLREQVKNLEEVINLLGQTSQQYLS